MNDKKTYVFYHGNCPDGFGSAYAVWKKLGDAAHYIPLDYGTFLDDSMMESIKGATVYFLDFTYPKEWMDKVVAVAGEFTSLDHHQGVRDVVESMPEHVYDSDRSGATITWSYFHPDTPPPKLILHIEDDDLFRFKLPETSAVLSYMAVHPYSFEFWDSVAKQLDSGKASLELLAVMHIYEEQFDLLVAISVEQAKLVEFEGYEIYYAYTHQIKPMKSRVGNVLVKKQGPVALVVSPHPKGYGVSIRGDGTVDVSKIAQKYGGNGHPNSSGFYVDANKPLPWKLVERGEHVAG